MMRFLWQVVLVVAVCLCASAATAQENHAEAVELIRAANADFDNGDFRASIIKYRRAYKLADDARILYRLGVAYEKTGNYQRASEHLSMFVLSDPEGPYAERTRQKIAELRARESEQAFVTFESTPSGARVFINGDTVSEGMTPLTVPVGVGQIEAVIASEDSQLQDAFNVAPGDTVKRVYDLAQNKLVSSVTEKRDDPVVATTMPVAMPMTYVSIAPPQSVSVIGWIAMSLGWVATVAGGYLGNIGMASGGVGMFAIGGYLIFIRDWTADLPDAQPAGQMAPAATAGWSLDF
ncbi:MAG: tetratricopeptide repeat protein [bacterium]